MIDNIVPTWQERLRKELETFDDDARPLLSSQLNAFQACSKLIKEQPLARMQITKKQRYGRLRGRTFLLDVFHNLGPELFILCCLTISISELSRIGQKDAVPKLREWWKCVNHPRGLTEIAGTLCRDLIEPNIDGSTKSLRDDETESNADQYSTCLDILTSNRCETTQTFHI